jgi:hypothetical protein
MKTRIFQHVTAVLEIAACGNGCVVLKDHNPKRLAEMITQQLADPTSFIRHLANLQGKLSEMISCFQTNADELMQRQLLRSWDEFISTEASALNICRSRDKSVNAGPVSVQLRDYPLRSQ